MGFNPLTGIRSFLTHRKSHQTPKKNKFQSPHGDSFFSDAEIKTAYETEADSFNPLTGIRSFLTP